jgi:imidazolonepropionase-like amidohydrolase
MRALTLSLLLLPTTLSAQAFSSLSENVREFVAVPESVVALAHVRVIDGTGAAALMDQTIVIQGGRIAAVGPAGSVPVPAGARVMDLTGHTVIPGMVGMHDHLFYTAAGGRAADLSQSGPRLYLASGVTTIRTTGTRAPYTDINTKAYIDAGQRAGPRIHITAPYITGAGGQGSMAALTTPEEARTFVAYWASEGAEWLKAYTNIHRAELRAAIEEAHRLGVKVTGHLCSVSFSEAVDLGIDNLEHGLGAPATDFLANKEPDQCPPNAMIRVASTADPTGPTAQQLFRKMIEHDVSMTSTLAVIEPFIPNRPTKDERTLEAMAPEIREAYLSARMQIDTTPNFPFSDAMFQTMMAFDKAFFDAGGLLASGVDPTGNGGALPGYGDQRNYELLIEAGFTPPQAVQVMTLNGARILGVADRLGSVEQGKAADLAVLRGDLTADPSVIRNVTVVFKDGVGYDSAKLIESVKGRVGIN